MFCKNRWYDEEIFYSFTLVKKQKTKKQQNYKKYDCDIKGRVYIQKLRLKLLMWIQLLGPSGPIFRFVFPDIIKSCYMIDIVSFSISLLAQIL